jgi:hypothetical protein
MVDSRSWRPPNRPDKRPRGSWRPEIDREHLPGGLRDLESTTIAPSEVSETPAGAVGVPCRFSENLERAFVVDSVLGEPQREINITKKVLGEPTRAVYGR